MDTWQYRLIWSWYPSLSRTAQEIQWMGLIILKTGTDTVDPKIESVEFAAFHKTKNTLGQIHENSRFIHERGQWYYLDGDLLAPLEFGRNDPCWSGSNKKFKKCHGRWCVEYFSEARLHFFNVCLFRPAQEPIQCFNQNSIYRCPIPFGIPFYPLYHLTGQFSCKFLCRISTLVSIDVFWHHDSFL